MDSTAEFERMERQLEMDTNDESMDHQAKKHKSFDESLELCSTMDNSLDQHESEPFTEESLTALIRESLQQSNMSVNNDEYAQVIHKLKDRFHGVEDIQKELDQMRRSVRELNSHRKRLNDHTHDDSDLIEHARRAPPAATSASTSLLFDNQLPKNITLLSSPSPSANLGVIDPDEKRLLLNQIKDLQDKYQSERQYYLEENEKLHSLNDEFTAIIDDYKSRENSLMADSKQYSSSGSRDASLSNGHRTGSHTFSGEHGEHSASKGYTPTNNRMLHVLSDIVKTVLDTGNDIDNHLRTLGLDSSGNSTIDLKRTFDDSFFYQGLPSIEGNDNLSDLTGEGLFDDPLTSGNSQYYPSSSQNNSLSQSHDKTGSGNEVEDDVVLVASKRLRSAVERVLKILSSVVDSHTSENSDLQAALQNESVCRDKLARQLIEKESLVSQLEKDKKTILERTADYFAIKAERDQFRTKAEEYEKDRDKFVEERTKFHDEKQQFVKGLPELQKKLSKENELLNADLTQLQSERENYKKQINLLTQEIDNLKHEKETIVEKNSAEYDDVICQIASHEKNFHSMQKFIEEQAADRETEREEYNREIATLQNRLKEYEKKDAKLSLNVKNIEDQLTLFQEERHGKDEKIEEMEKQAKLSSVKISELNMNIKKLEKELYDNQKVKELLRHRLKDVSQNLNLKTTERLDWEELLQVINNLVDLEKANLKLKNVKDKNLKVKFDVSDSLQNDSGSGEDNSVFLTINLLNNKLKTLNEEVDALIEKNRLLSADLEASDERIRVLEQIKLEKQQMEKDLFEFKKENQLLQDEINDNHLKYSELKVKVENSIDVQHFKRVVDELEGKLNGERSVNENLKLRVEQTNRDYAELEEKLSAGEKEIASYKELLKSYENQQKNALKDRNDIRERFDSLHAQFGENNLKLLTKDKTIGVLEQNLDLLKTKLRSLQVEKDIYLEKLKSMDENQNQVIVYEKNMDKLRLQLKIAQDRVNFLDIEVRNLKKKSEIVERENQVLKVENYKISKSKTDSALATRAANGDVDDESDGHAGGAQNVLMLKVRRLSGQKNALIYQKNYLLHLLDSCQSGEMDTLAVLDRLNQYKDFEDVENRRPLRGKAKFRAVVYAVISTRRMNWLARLWQCRKQEYLVHRAAAALMPSRTPTGGLQNGTNRRLAGSSSSVGSVSSSSSSASSTLHRGGQHYVKSGPTLADLNSSMKIFVDRLHNVHDNLGLQTKKL